MGTNYSTAVMLFNPAIKGIKVSYEPDNAHKTYLFKTLDGNLKVGDYVVIPTEGRHHATVGRVEEVDVDVDFDSSIQIKWIIDTVNKPAYEMILEEEKKMIDTMKKSEAAKKRKDMAENLASFHENVDFGDLALTKMKSPNDALQIESKPEETSNESK